MKRLNYLLGCILSLSLLLACSKDNSENRGGDENSGGVYAAFSIKMGGANTRAVTEPGKSEESTIASVHIFMFDVNVDGQDTLVSSGSIIMNGLIGSTTLATTLGEKTVYALINATNNINLPTLPVGTTKEVFKTTLKQEGILNDDKIANSGRFLMFGVTETNITKEINETEALAKATPILINVNRISSKVSFIYGGSVVVENLKGTVGEVQFALNQTNTKVDIVRELREETSTSAAGAINYTATDANAESSEGTYTHLHRTTDGDYKLARSTPEDASEVVNSHYCLENINTKPVTGNSTFVVVKLKFVPAESDFSEHASTKLLGEDGSFWIVLWHGQKFIFANETEANAAVALMNGYTGGIVYEYTRGYCYYRLNLRDQAFGKEPAIEMTKRYAVLRNAVYKVNITKVKGIGERNPEDLIPIDPTTPLEEDAYMTAEITILDWTVVEMDEELN